MSQQTSFNGDLPQLNSTEFVLRGTEGAPHFERSASFLPFQTLGLRKFMNWGLLIPTWKFRLHGQQL